MSLIQWDNSMSVKVEEIDKQHKLLINTINELFDAMKAGDATPKLDHIFFRLNDYIIIHFATEEKYFHEFNYKFADEHIAEHRKFKDKIKQFTADHKAKKASLQISMLNFLHDWFRHHFSGQDQEYVQCFKEHGLR